MANPVTHWQMLTKNMDGTVKFYTQLFDWKVSGDNALGYKMVQTGASGLDGGFWPIPPDGHQMVTPYVQVEDMKAYLDKAQSLGAKVIIPAQKLPDGDEMAILQDPQGITFGLMTRKDRGD